MECGGWGWRAAAPQAQAPGEPWQPSLEAAGYQHTRRRPRYGCVAVPCLGTAACSSAHEPLGALEVHPRSCLLLPPSSGDLPGGTKRVCSSPCSWGWAPLGLRISPPFLLPRTGPMVPNTPCAIRMLLVLTVSLGARSASEMEQHGSSLCSLHPALTPPVPTAAAGAGFGHRPAAPSPEPGHGASTAPGKHGELSVVEELLRNSLDKAYGKQGNPRSPGREQPRCRLRCRGSTAPGSC